MKGNKKMKSMTKLIALLLAIIMLLCSCNIVGQDQLTDPETSVTPTVPEETDPGTESKPDPDDDGDKTEPIETDAPLSEYRQSISRTREEVEAMITITDDVFADVAAKLAAFEEIAVSSTDIDAIDAVYVEFEDMYYYVSTQVSLTSIVYNLNHKNKAASERYLSLFEKYGDMHDSYMETCKKVYNESPVRDELFADWTEEEIKQLLNFSPESTELTLKNEDLTDKLNKLPTFQFTDESAKIYAQIVENNNRIAELAGYSNYYEYATKEIYMRDYGIDELEQFCSYVAELYVPQYKELYDKFYSGYTALSDSDREFMLSYLYDPFDSMDTNYLADYIASLSGSMKEGMEHAFINRNMIFASSPNSHQSAYQTYLDDLDMPFCLFGADGQSSSTIVHELGHYYASLHNDISSYDLAEVQSQGNEMLLLDYLNGKIDPSVYVAIKDYSMYNNITTIILCVIIDEFEREVYSLESVEGYTSKDFDAIMSKVCEKYGGITFVKTYITDVYDYWRRVATQSPVYYISYAVSLTSALNLYSEISDSRANGREIYRILVEDVAEDEYFLTALQKAGLLSPFDKESAEQIVNTVWGKFTTN